MRSLPNSDGGALVQQGFVEEGRGEIREGMRGMEAMGTQARWPSYLSLLIEAYRKLGQIEEGVAGVDDALAWVDKTGERLDEAELYRLKGELALQSDAQQDAEQCFYRALSIARRQQAKSLELRAATSLARLWQQQDKEKEARDLLAPVYDWFTEGFDTADLKDAKALLEALA